MRSLGSGVGVSGSFTASIGADFNFAPIGWGIALPADGVATEGRASGIPSGFTATPGAVLRAGGTASSDGGVTAATRGAVVRAGDGGNGGRGTGTRGAVTDG